MYQVSVSISKQNENWLLPQEKLVAAVASCGGVYAGDTKYDRVYFNFACKLSSSCELKKAIKDYMSELYLTKAKKEYMRKNIKIKVEIFDILLSILVGFDRESEKELLDKILVIEDDFSIDGYFNFRLTELKTRWDEICSLARENAFFLSNRETMYELLRFLMSTIKPQVERITVKQKEDRFVVLATDDIAIARFDTAEELMLYFIETAPLEIRIIGDILPAEQRRILNCIFEDKLSAKYS
ncbi:MAG: hypothetical protein LBU60_04675 [Clostridiales bacterium]|jgi:hypothetical protein|nr:hypothetical protein [Clostridiales bacterium]